MRLWGITRWIAPVAISYGLFLVVSDMSGMPFPLVDPGIVPTGSSVMGSGLILWAMVMLLIGMIGIYARLMRDGDTARKAAEREARYREWELDEEELLLVSELDQDAPETHQTEELLVASGSPRRD